jgi:hypothetical protein
MIAALFAVLPFCHGHIQLVILVRTPAMFGVLLSLAASSNALTTPIRTLLFSEAG